jgi:hypothetical protein
MVALRLTDLRRFDTHRLLPAKYSPNYDSALTRIADDDESIEFAEIDWKEREEIGYDDYLADFTVASTDRSNWVWSCSSLARWASLSQRPAGRWHFYCLFSPQRCCRCVQEHTLPAHLDSAAGPLCPPGHRVNGVSSRTTSRRCGERHRG